MQFKEYMQQVDNQLSQMTLEEMTAWIYQTARVQPVEKRQMFLSSLSKKPEGNENSKELTVELNKINSWLVKIEEQDSHFDCHYNDEEWDEEPYTYEDPFEIGPKLQQSFELADRLFLAKRYKEAAKLFDWLCSMLFQAEDEESGELQELELDDLVTEGILNLDLTNVCLSLLYAQYQATAMKKRPAILYRYLSWEMCRNIRMEDLFSFGPDELVDTDEFMANWISFLKKTPSDKAGRYLIEACLYHRGLSFLCETAKEVRLQHPMLYEEACIRLLEEGRLEECETVGLRAVQQLPTNWLIRGRVADIAVKAAVQLNHEESIKQFYEAAFYSSTTIVHYLRLFELPNYAEMTKTAANSIQRLPGSTIKKSYQNLQLEENSCSQLTKQLIRFFNYEFDAMGQLAKADHRPLGWSNSLKGALIPLFLLALDKSEYFSTAEGIIIQSLAIRLSSGQNKENFEDLFENWKETIKFTAEERDLYLTWLEQEVADRTEAIVGDGFRKSYHKAAELIVVLGDVLESNGNPHSKEQLIEHYKTTYSRKRAFKSELEELQR